MIYYVPPYPGKVAWIADLKAQGEAPILLNFLDPDRFPQLYQLEYRFDRFHVNTAGAQNFSALFGEGVRRALSGEPIQ